MEDIPVYLDLCWAYVSRLLLLLSVHLYSALSLRNS